MVIATRLFVTAILIILGLVCDARAQGLSAETLEIPEVLRPYVQTITVDELGGVQAETRLERIDENLYRLRLTFDLPAEAAQDDWQVKITPAFQPSFHWSPHLTPADKHIVDQHAFRSPALVANSDDKGLTVVPDLDIMSRGTPVRWYMDMDAPRNTLVLGMSDYGFDVVDRLLFVRKPGAVYASGEVEFGFYLFVTDDEGDLQNPWRRPLAFLWKNWGRALFESGQPLKGDLGPYVEHTYNWAFNTWKDSIWQEFELNGKKVGAPVFIVNVTQSPNYPGVMSEREFRSVWNQAWFSSLRSASGLYRYGRRTKNMDLMEKALLTKELALAAPMKDGLFDTVIATEMEMVEIEGKQYKRSKGWETAFWGNSNRNPVNRPVGERSNRDCRIAPYHVLDMSWTALLMLRWHEELEKDTRLVDYARIYADRLLKLQDEEGFFPAWLDKTSQRSIFVLDRSPETSMSVTFLLKLAEITGNEAYRESGLKAMDAVAREIVPAGRWEDFETYWSSSPYGAGPLVGKKVARNNMHKQCNFSMFWTTEALYEAYQVTKDRKYLQWGQRVLDEMLMTQASWQPPYMYVNVLGGFGVMNCDGEWLDSRESLFAEIIVKYGQELNCTEYIQRGLAALRSSFVMMYCPENPKTKLQWEKKHPFFGPADYGFTMENYAHGGRTSPEGAGMGVFTIYDWGNGAASEAYNRMLDHFGADLVQREE
jgi:hypothetical protein